MLLTRRRLLAAAAAGLIVPRSARAQLATAGAGKSVRSAAAPAYTPQAVHFDGLTWLINAALASSDNEFISFSFWFKPSTPAVYTTVFIVDPVNLFLTQALIDDEGNLLIGVFKDDFSQILDLRSTDTPLAVAQWYHILVAIQTSLPSKQVIYINDAPYTIGVNGANTAAFNISSNGLPFWVGSDSYGDNLGGDVVDTWIAPGVSLLDGGADIPLATRRKFISGTGAPVYLGANGELPTGTDPAVFLSASSGNAASFATNRGTGGAFTTTGTLTLASGP